MTDNSLEKSIYENFSVKETDELIQIWRENQRYEWSDVAFDVIRQILQERGVEIPLQNNPQFELETKNENEESESADGTSSENQPIFYKPQQLMFFADAASIAAWVTLVIYIVISPWNVFLNWSEYWGMWGLGNGIVGLLSRILVAAISFFLLKGISLALYVLMEFEFNSRHVK